jgi:hypothetical protein
LLWILREERMSLVLLDFTVQRFWTSRVRHC